MANSSRAIVLSLENFGEADRYVQFFTQKWGMITLLAKSARKSLRRYVGGLDLFCHSEIFVKGDPGSARKERGYLNELSVINSFPGLREDLEKMMAAGKVAQWVRKLADTTSPMPQVYSLLGQTLTLIEKETDPKRFELLHLVFKLKLLSAIGLKPRTEACVACESPAPQFRLSEEPILFDMHSGGILCPVCCRTVTKREGIYLSPDETFFLDMADKLRLSQWPEIKYAEEKVLPLSRLVTRFASYHNHVALPA